MKIKFVNDVLTNESIVPISIHKQCISSDFNDERQKYDIELASSEIRLSIVIVAYNEGQSLVELVDCLVQQQTPMVEIIVIDNGLDSETRYQLSVLPIIYLNSGDNLGPSRGRNLGASVAAGTHLIFLDADGSVGTTFLKEAESLVNEDFVAARGRVKVKTPDSFTPTHYDLGEDVVSSCIITEGISIWDSGVFKRSGGFDDNYYGHEGLILSYRVYELFNIPFNQFKYFPQLVLKHDYSSSEVGLTKKKDRHALLDKSIKKQLPLLPSYRQHYSAKMKKSNQTRSKKTGPELDYWLKTLTSRQVQSQPDTEAPNFSVIIPCYNLGKYLLRAVNSVQLQTILDVEIIVVDDCSTDRHTKEALGSLDSKIKVIRHIENQGVSSARNTGIHAAKSEYILCLDADDIIDESYLEKARRVFELDPNIGMVGCWVRMFGERNTDWRPKDKPEVANSLLTSPLPTATCFRKSAWLKTNGGYCSNLSGYEDWDYWLSLMEAGFIARVVPEFLFYYHTRPGSKVSKSNDIAYQLVSKIVERHQTSYTDNLAHVIASQREKINKLTDKVAELKAPNPNGRMNGIATLIKDIGSTVPDAGTKNITKKEKNRIHQMLSDMNRARKRSFRGR